MLGCAGSKRARAEYRVDIVSRRHFWAESTEPLGEAAGPKHSSAQRPSGQRVYCCELNTDFALPTFSRQPFGNFLGQFPGLRLAQVQTTLRARGSRVPVGLSVGPKPESFLYALRYSSTPESSFKGRRDLLPKKARPHSGQPCAGLHGELHGAAFTGHWKPCSASAATGVFQQARL